MQNKYAGDVGDFGKFGLLNYLFSDKKWKIGVIWFLYPDEKNKNDGNHINYLSRPEFVICDPDLINKLGQVACSSNRNVKALEEIGILKPGTVYYGELLDFYHNFPGQTKENKERRIILRRRWLQRAIEITKECNVLFVDPDNGLEIKSCPNLNQKKSGKYIYYSEIKELFKGKEVLVIYHHLNRHKNHGSHEQQIRNRAVDLYKLLPPQNSVFAIRFKRYSQRAYFIICSSESKNIIRNKLKKFLNTPWGKHWDSFCEV